MTFSPRRPARLGTKGSTMAEGAIFSAFLRLEYQDDGSAKSRFIRAVDDTLGSAEKRFETFSAEARRQLDAALSIKRNAFGSLDVGAADAQAAARAAQVRAAAARELAAATATAAREQEDYSQSARLAVAALEAQAREEEQAAKVALSHAAALEQVQTILNRQVSATTAVIRGTRGLSSANDNTRMGLQQLSFQLNDVATMWALGARPMQIFASQSGQVIQAVQMMSGGTSKLAGFLGGPWGLALTSAAVVLAPFVGKLFDAATAEAKVEFGAYKLSDAQSVLGNVFDLTTGKIRTQSDALIGLAKAQAIAGQIQAQQDMANARRSLSGTASFRPHITAGFGGGLNVTMGRDAAGDIASAVLDNSLNTQEAIAGLNSLRKSGYATEQQFLDTAKAVTDLGVAGENLKVFQQAEKALGGDRSALSGFLKPDRHKPRNDSSAAQLAEFGEDAAKKIANVRDSFADIPPEVEKSNKATRELDDVISDLERRKPKGFQELVEQAERLKQIIPTLGLDRALRELSTESEHRAQIDQLVLQGRNAEANALQQIWELEKQFAPLDEAHRQEIEQTAKAEQDRIEANQRLLDLQRDYLDATRSVRGEIESILAGEGKLGDFKQIFRQLNAKVLTEQIFGGALRDLDQWVKENTGIKDSVDYFRDETHAAGESALNFADTVNAASNRIATGHALGGFAGASAAPDDLAYLFDAVLPPFAASAKPGIPGLAPAANDNAEIVVNGRPLDQSVMGLTPERYFAETTRRLTDPLITAIERNLGIKLPAEISGALSGALYGYSTGGAVGGVLGAAGGLVDDLRFKVPGLGGVSNTLNNGLRGAQTGSLIAGLGNMFGLHLSSGGAQLGGALGGALSFIPGGSLIGSIAGGIIGKLFGGTKSGRVTLNGTGLTLGGTNKQLQAAAGQTGSDLLSTLQSVAEQLGGTLGSYGTITLGQRNGSYRVNVGGSGSGSLKTGHGAKDFGTDEQAAIAYALQQAIVHGAVRGISAGAQRLLAAGNDLQAQLKKALDFQGVFDELKQATDPVGYALDRVNKEFSRLKDMFAEAGASAEDYAKLQQLYGIERTKALSDAMNQVGGSLKSLYDDLTTGDMGLSLRDREKTAQGNYDALAARVRAGDSSAYDDFAEAVRTLLDIERQLHGSQSAYFATFDNVLGLTKTTLDKQKALIDGAAGGDSPFSSAGNGASAGARPDNQGVIDGLDRLGNTIVSGLGYKLDAVNANLGSALAKIGGASGGPAQVSVFDLLSASAGRGW
jgi:hypothetical protein